MSFARDVMIYAIGVAAGVGGTLDHIPTVIACCAAFAVSRMAFAR